MIERKIIEEAVKNFGPISTYPRETANHFNGSSDRQLERIGRIGAGGVYTDKENEAIARYAADANDYRLKK